MQYKACVPMIAEVDAENSASSMAYKANSGKAVGKLMNVKVDQTRSNVKAYGDDGVAEEINQFVSATVTLDATFVPADCEKPMFGNTYTAATTGQNPTPETIVDSESDDPGYTGFGFVYCDRQNGADVYRLYWLYKVKWTNPNDDFTTKKENIEFKNPSITGTAYAGPDGKWRKRETYATAAAALSALETLAQKPATVSSGT